MMDAAAAGFTAVLPQNPVSRSRAGKRKNVLYCTVLCDSKYVPNSLTIESDPSDTYLRHLSTLDKLDIQNLHSYCVLAFAHALRVCYAKEKSR